jgi:hypothetical protein
MLHDTYLPVEKNKIGAGPRDRPKKANLWRDPARNASGNERQQNSIDNNDRRKPFAEAVALGIEAYK